MRQLVANLRQSPSAKITSEARKRRYERQSKEALAPEESERRATLVSATFEGWSFGDESIPQYKVTARQMCLPGARKALGGGVAFYF